MLTRYFKHYRSWLAKLIDLPPLFFRLILAHGFYEPAIRKVSNIQGIIEWFTGMGYPLPALNAYMAAITETVGFVLLFLGLATRFITIPLMVTMVVAVTTVHWSHGFSCGDNGIQIPFYFFFLLFALLIGGAGRISLDHLIAKRLIK